MSVGVMFALLLCCACTKLAYVSSSAQLNPNVPPGSNFDLSHYYLTIPDANTTEIKTTQLVNGYESQYFYTNKTDGSMVFWVPSSGGHTTHSVYPRSELRHMCNASSTHYNWNIMDGVYTQNVTLAIGGNSTTDIGNLQGYTMIISQIHPYYGSTPPLAKVRWYSNTTKVEAEYKLDHAGKIDRNVDMGNFLPGTKFNIVLKIDHGWLYYYLNGQNFVTADISSYWANYSNYFKIGNYFNNYSDVALIDDFHTLVQVYELHTNINGSCDYYE